VSVLHGHLVLVTRYRHPVCTARHHVHLLVKFPPKVALSRLVNSLKGVSSRRLRQGIPRTATAPLESEPAVVRVVLRRAGRRCTDLRPAPVHRTAGQARL